MKQTFTIKKLQDTNGLCTCSLDLILLWLKVWWPFIIFNWKKKKKIVKILLQPKWNGMIEIDRNSNRTFLPPFRFGWRIETRNYGHSSQSEMEFTTMPTSGLRDSFGCIHINGLGCRSRRLFTDRVHTKKWAPLNYPSPWFNNQSLMIF